MPVLRNLNKKEPGTKEPLANVSLSNEEADRAPLPLVPPAILVPLWFISLALPNLVYSGMSWFDTLHIVKWAVAAIPVGICAFVAGLRLAYYGRERVHLKIDLFGTLWMALLAYTTAQALWVDISSRTGFVHELLCFMAVWVFYVISWNSFPDRALRPLLWLANINAAVNVVFAELQMRDLNDFTSFILPTPFNYIGNTGQQNMFGLWMAICVMSSIYLYVAYATTHSGKKRHPAVTALNIALLLINMWGLLNSTSRSAALSLLCALFLMGFITSRQFGKEYARRLFHVGLLFMLVSAVTIVINQDRATEMVAKTVDMVQNAETFGGRDGIWATSRAMFDARPFSGVGIGQYKWHYLEAQLDAFKKHPAQLWQYTHWAHNEFLQWFCEGGVVGGLLLLSLWGVWGVFLIKMLWRREDAAREVIWACALVALISFNAFWTRPFHRIENILWLSLAFAVSNRAMVSTLSPDSAFRMGNLSRVCGTVLCAAGALGLYYLVGGMVGDRTIRAALESRNPIVQRNLLQSASRYLMTREEAVRQLGYHYMRLGEQADDIDALDRGFGIIWGHFLREPHSEDMGFLIDWAQRFQNIPMLETLVSYLKPGTFRLDTQKHVLEDGSVINAVVLVPLHSSGGMVFNSRDLPSGDSSEDYWGKKD